MNLAELMKKNRREELKAIYKFIDRCDFKEIASIVEEIRCVHNNLVAWNEKTKSLDKVKSISIDGECIQLNLQ